MDRGVKDKEEEVKTGRSSKKYHRRRAKTRRGSKRIWRGLKNKIKGEKIEREIKEKEKRKRKKRGDERSGKWIIKVERSKEESKEEEWKK